MKSQKILRFVYLTSSTMHLNKKITIRKKEKRGKESERREEGWKENKKEGREEKKGEKTNQQSITSDILNIYSLSLK